MHTSQLARPWLEVRAEAIVSNARALARRVAPAALCGVVKSNAYGHGLVPVARALSEAGIARLRLAVFTFAEAAALRAAGIRTPLIVLGPVGDDDVAAAVAAGVSVPVLEPAGVERLPAGARVHVKVDTGVARFGVRPKDAGRTIERSMERGLRVDGVYSHLANAEDLDRRFTDEQATRLASIDAPAGAVKHLAASAAAIMWPHTRLDMVRCGIALYGHWPSKRVEQAPESSGLRLARALSWHAPVSLVRQVEAGDTVGYGCEYTALASTAVAVLPLGYADGLPRRAGGGALSVRIRGERAPVIGRICMNACMVDVTAVPGVIAGDVVEIDIDDVAAAAGTINYEILARLPESLERRPA